MNLALLDPFRRSVPDRIDSTLTLPKHFHPLKNNPKEADLLLSKSSTKNSKKRKKSSPSSAFKKKYDDSATLNGRHSCFSVAFNRRGTYIAAGHASGVVAFHDFGSRTLGSVLTPPRRILEACEGNGERKSSNDAVGGLLGVQSGLQGDRTSSSSGSSSDIELFPNGITSVSWSRRSRSVLVASYGDKHVCLSDNMHPFGVKDAFRGLKVHSSKKSKSGSDMDAMAVPLVGTEDDGSILLDESEVHLEDEQDAIKRRELSPPNKMSRMKKPYEYQSVRYIPKAKTLPFINSEKKSSDDSSPIRVEENIGNKGKAQSPLYQSLVMPLPDKVGTCVQIHPKGIGGLACLQDGSLVLFRFPLDGFQTLLHAIPCQDGNKSSDNDGRYVYLSQPAIAETSTHDESHIQSFRINCATFDGRGHCIYAATSCGKVLFYQLNDKFMQRMFDPNYPSIQVSEVLRNFTCVDLGGNIAAQQMVLSRNGQMIVLNCSDSLKLYNTHDVRQASTENCGDVSVKPRFIFQDVVSKSKWHACDFSGDGEYVVGGCNNSESGNKYELYFWNTTTGILIDQLMGPQITLHSISWHPTRSFIAVGTSDGIVDIWGPRMDWTAFAPDFQALQKNVEYIEKEDEFDIVVDCDEDKEEMRKKMLDTIEDQVVVDVTTVDKVLAFDSDSEGEEDVFYFHHDLRAESKL